MILVRLVIILIAYALQSIVVGRFAIYVLKAFIVVPEDLGYNYYMLLGYLLVWLRGDNGLENSLRKNHRERL